MISTLMVAATLLLMSPKGAHEEVTTTGYCWHAPCVNAKHAKGITRSGTHVQPGVCAADWTVYPAGSWFFIPGYGLCRVEDTGRLVKGRHLDLFFRDIREARAWGIRRNQKVRRVYIVETQLTIGSWATKNFGKPTPLAVLRRSCDELLEAMEVCVINNDATRTMFAAMRMGLKHLDSHAHTPQMQEQLIPLIAKELADSMIVNYHAAEVMGVEIHGLIDSKMYVNRRRKWKQNADGTGQHINVDEDIVLASADEEETLS